MAYSIGESIAKPFWAKSIDFIGGRDPLGIQNSSVSVYTRLLPGLNNVTERLRYYGFYCWLLSKAIGKNLTFGTSREQFNYIRKAEYSLALYMAINEPGIGNVAGIDYANKLLQQNPGIQFVDIAKGAEKHSTTIKGSVYWDFGSGAMGQYYAGSLLALGLVKTKEKYFIITQTGEKLAEAFGKTISSNSEDFLFRCIEVGQLSVPDSYLLKDFSPTGIEPGSDECLFYCNMFFSADLFETYTTTEERTFYRLQSFKLFIDYLLQCKSAKPWATFPSYIYEERGFIAQPIETGASVGWFYYQTNELVHYGLESIFCAILLTVEKGIIEVNELVANLSEATLTSFQEKYGSSHDQNVSALINASSGGEKTTAYPEKLSHLTKEKNIPQILSVAFELLFNVYVDTLPYQEKFVSFSMSTDTRYKNGTALDFFDKEIKANLNTSIDSFIRRIISKVINDHIYISYTKMGNGEGQVHKVLIEDNFLIHIATVYPRFTSPRLRTVMNFLEDLKVIEVKQDQRIELTEIGKLVYEQYC